MVETLYICSRHYDPPPTYRQTATCGVRKLSGAKTMSKDSGLPSKRWGRPGDSDGEYRRETVVDAWDEYGKRGTQYRKLWVHILIGLSFSLRLTYRRHLILHRSPSKRREKRRPIGSGSRPQHHGCPVPHHHFVHVSNDYARDCGKINQAEGAIKQAMWQKTFPNQPLFRRCARLPSPITRL